MFALIVALRAGIHGAAESRRNVDARRGVERSARTDRAGAAGGRGGEKGREEKGGGRRRGGVRGVADSGEKEFLVNFERDGQLGPLRSRSVRPSVTLRGVPGFGRTGSAA